MSKFLQLKFRKFLKRFDIRLNTFGTVILKMTALPKRFDVILFRLIEPVINFNVKKKMVI